MMGANAISHRHLPQLLSDMVYAAPVRMYVTASKSNVLKDGRRPDAKGLWVSLGDPIAAGIQEKC